MQLNYEDLENEIIKLLENTQTITLATCFNNKVTARSMAIINDGLTILFQTGGHSEKIQQLSQNPNVAFAVGNIQIEAVARITKNPEEIQTFIGKYKAKYPQYYATYSNMPDETTVVCAPVRFALYKFIDGKPCTDVLEFDKNYAYRKVLT